MKKYLSPYLLIPSVFLMIACDSDPKPEEQIEIPDGYTLVWQDEFEQGTINSDNWNFETGNGTGYGLPAGWGNNEKQIYTDSEENAHIETDGSVSSLLITADEDGSGAFTSAKLTTKDLFSMRFGRVDVRAKMPEGQGLWAAIWMLGDNRALIDWPGCGEIDIAEVLGSSPSTLYSTLHFTNGENKKDEIQGVKELAGSSFSSDYHLYTLEWTPESLVFKLDDVKFQEVPIEAGMKEFQRSFYLILNVAVGGYWPGEPDNTTSFPQTMYIDYVRAYSKDGFTAPEAPALVVEEETIGQIIEPDIADNAIKTGFTELGNMKVVSYGGGGEPVVSTSETAIDGDLSLAFAFPGGNWGGGYIELAAPKNFSNFNAIVFSLNKPQALVNAEIKLEGVTTNAIILLKNYTGTALTDGFVEYRIPLSDFVGLDLTKLRIPFSIWNPQDNADGFVAATVLIDNLHFVTE